MSTQSKPRANSTLANYYGNDFYDSQIEGSLRSAIKYVDFFATIYKPSSVVDVGCGRGTWLKAFKDSGVETVVGYDGTWNNQGNMIDQSIVFYGVDLNEPITAADKIHYDLALSLEVAEHLEASSASNFVGSLTQLSDTVMFGAAYTKQGGTNHINEQPHTYWAKIFASYDYAPYDLFRPIFWGDNEIHFWYRQNTFLYVRRGAAIAKLLSDTGYHSLTNIDFMDCVHPILYNSKLEQIRMRSLIKQLALTAIPQALRPLARKFKKAIS